MLQRKKVTFEKVSEDANGGTIYHVEAIHVTTTRNNRKYNKEELVLGARSLSYRPININHDESRWLPYDYTNPMSEGSNATIIMDFDPSSNGVVGDLWITDAITKGNIEAGNIKTVSIEQLPTKGERCSCMVDHCTCEQDGIVFTGIAILETFKGVQPGDPNATIRKGESAEPKAVGDKGKDDDTDDKEYEDKDKDKECPEGKKLVDGKCVDVDADEPTDKEECGCIEKQFMKWAEAYLTSLKLAGQ